MKKKIIRITESQLMNIIERAVNEQAELDSVADLKLTNATTKVNEILRSVGEIPVSKEEVSSIAGGCEEVSQIDALVPKDKINQWAKFKQSVDKLTLPQLISELKKTKQNLREIENQSKMGSVNEQNRKGEPHVTPGGLAFTMLGMSVGGFAQSAGAAVATGGLVWMGLAVVYILYKLIQVTIYNLKLKGIRVNCFGGIFAKKRVRRKSASKGVGL